MVKVDKTVKKETLYIAVCVVILSVIMQAVFLCFGKWDYTVLFGNLLSSSGMVLNFFLMGLTVQKAVTKEEKNAKSIMQISQMLRYLLLAVVLGSGVALSCFNTLSVIIPVIFPRIAIALRPQFFKKSGDDNG